MTGTMRTPVLVAEDSEDNRFLLEVYCINTPFDLTFAENGEKAIKAFESGVFDIVVMDIQMPVMDGLAATRWIRDVETRHGSRRIPILALTANVMPKDVLSALEAGCDVHLPKPISKASFLRALATYRSEQPRDGSHH